MDSKKFNLNDLGLSERQMAEHVKLYEGYCKKIDEIRKKVSETNKEGNATYSEIRELKLEEGFCINAIKLHELFFEKLGKKEIGKDLLDRITQSFGSYEYWKAEFIALAMSARGWVILAWDYKDNKLHNYIADMHNQGGVWDTVPLLVLDMYEHAYFIDFGTDKKKYIEWFLENINWEAVEKSSQKI
jgi:superoxide dismutase, Fe-Mn family